MNPGSLLSLIPFILKLLDRASDKMIPNNADKNIIYRTISIESSLPISYDTIFRLKIDVMDLNT